MMGDLEDALYLVRRLGVYGARQYASKRLWVGMSAILETLDSRQTRARNIRHLQLLIVQATARSGEAK